VPLLVIVLLQRPHDRDHILLWSTVGARKTTLVVLQVAFGRTEQVKAVKVQCRKDVAYVSTKVLVECMVGAVN
jgi:hypothetical protein